MRTSLQAIANRAKESKRYRFGNLYTMLNRLFLEDSWKYLKRSAAPGIDRVTVQDFERNFAGNVVGLVEQLKRKRYRAKLVKRVYIPKANGKKRPLGLPATIDKLLQKAVARILGAIYEQDFLSGSYGYRPHRGSLDAVKHVSKTLRFGPYNYVVEADIKGYFDSIDHDWLVKMLEQRINDNAFIRLIKKWLKAGILEEDKKILHPITGTPQGGIVSPILANIYLHYALDLWFEKRVRQHCEGAVYMCRYADDFICAFEYKEDAERFYRVLPKRLGRFGLEIAPEKTNIIRFCRGNGDGNGRFDFLGFEFRWDLSRKGKPSVMRRTSRKKFRASLRNITEWCRKNRSMRFRKLMGKLNRKLVGYYNYYGVIGNYKSLAEFLHQVKRILFKWVNRRSQKRSFTWKKFHKALDFHGIAKPRITEKTEPQLRLAF